jgi:hypothetical protein
MPRPKKTKVDDIDSFYEATLDLDTEERAPEMPPYDPETDDILPELGETERHDRFDRLNDEELFQNDRE